MRRSTPRRTTYPVFVRLFEGYEQDLIDRLPTLYPNESDEYITEKILIAQWRSCLITVLDSFIERTRSMASDRPIAQALASLCTDVDKVVKENRFLLDIDGSGKPLYEYVVACRKSVGKAIMKELKTKRNGAEAHDPMSRRSGSAGPIRPKRRCGRIATRDAQALSN